MLSSLRSSTGLRWTWRIPASSVTSRKIGFRPAAETGACPALSTRGLEHARRFSASRRMPVQRRPARSRGGPVPARAARRPATFNMSGSFENTPFTNLGAFAVPTLPALPGGQSDRTRSHCLGGAGRDAEPVRFDQGVRHGYRTLPATRRKPLAFSSIQPYKYSHFGRASKRSAPGARENSPADGCSAPGRTIGFATGDARAKAWPVPFVESLRE